METIIKELLSECDHDIAELMLADYPQATGDSYKGWQLVNNPVQTIIDWQALREWRNKT